MAELITIPQGIIEIVSDSGEGSQTAGQMFGNISARMGNGVWTVEIIPAEIEPPPRSRAGASGNRVRIGSGPITNMGDAADVVIAFNEQAPYGRIDVHAYRKGTQIFLENKWATVAQEDIRAEYQKAVADFKARGYIVRDLPMEVECLKIVKNARQGKNMWALGFLMALYNRDIDIAKDLIEAKFKRKGEDKISSNQELILAGYEYGLAHLEVRYNIPAHPCATQQVVMSGNQAIAMGTLAAGFELCSMYPITPATSVSHGLAGCFHQVGGFVHQAEDEIAAIGFALGASYAGRTALTVTSGPGLALKTEFLGLAVMSEIPLVIVDVQRGGPSTGLPTRVEQSDLLAVLHGSPGDAPKIVLAPSTIEECFYMMIRARELAERFRGPVFVLSDANLATGVQPFPKPELKEEWLAPENDQSDWDAQVKPYDWDPVTGLSKRPLPGQKNGEYVLTGLAHDEHSKIAYVSSVNQRASEYRSRKLDTLRNELPAPVVNGDSTGDLLVVGWGSTRGAIEEAVARLRTKGWSVASLNITYLSPLQPGLKEIFSHYKKILAIEINYSDPEDRPHRRLGQLTQLLRAETLVDVACWSRVPGIPLQPGILQEAIAHHLTQLS